MKKNQFNFAALLVPIVSTGYARADAPAGSSNPPTTEQHKTISPVTTPPRLPSSQTPEALENTSNLYDDTLGVSAQASYQYLREDYQPSLSFESFRSILTLTAGLKSDNWHGHTSVTVIPLKPAESAESIWRADTVHLDFQRNFTKTASARSIKLKFLFGGYIPFSWGDATKSLTVNPRIHAGAGLDLVFPLVEISGSTRFHLPTIAKNTAKIDNINVEISPAHYWLSQARVSFNMVESVKPFFEAGLFALHGAELKTPISERAFSSENLFYFRYGILIGMPVKILSVEATANKSFEKTDLQNFRASTGYRSPGFLADSFTLALNVRI